MSRHELHQRHLAAMESLRRQSERLQSALQACRQTTQLVGRLSGEARAPRLFARDRLRLGEAEVMLPRQEVRHAGGTYRLTPTEWQLLAFLLANPGVVHSRLDLAVGAWGPGFAERNSEVEVYVSRLRRKLGPAGAQLETVRGQGYRLTLQAAGSLSGAMQRLGGDGLAVASPSAVA